MCAGRGPEARRNPGNDHGHDAHHAALRIRARERSTLAHGDRVAFGGRSGEVRAIPTRRTLPAPQDGGLPPVEAGQKGNNGRGGGHVVGIAAVDGTQPPLLPSSLEAEHGRQCQQQAQVQQAAEGQRHPQ